MKSAYWCERVLLVFLHLGLAEDAHAVDIIEARDLRQATHLLALLLECLYDTRVVLKKFVVLND